MKEYPKIQSVFKRDMEKSGHPIIEGAFTLPEFEYLKCNCWIATEKVDGTNIRVVFDPIIDSLVFFGRTHAAEIPKHLHEKLRQLFTVDTFKTVFDKNEENLPVCLYGEGYGMKIQKGGGSYIPDDVGFILFDVKIGNFWLKRDALEDIAKKFNIPIVPILYKATLLDLVSIVKYGFPSVLRKELPEGLVMKPEVEFFNRKGERVITKLKIKDFTR